MRLSNRFPLALTLLSVLLPSTASAQPPAAPLTWDNLAARLTAEAENGFTGAVLIVREGETVVDTGYGLANRERGIPVTPETIFATGSEPIDFTHVAILQLAQAGKLSLSDPITRFFDDVPADKRAITVEHLMTGASGLQNFHDVPGDRDPDHSWIDRDEAMRRIFAQELLFAPGEGEEHSHSAWGVLAAIVEIAGGQSYQDYTREHIYEPAGMVDTGFNGDPVPVERLAVGYGTRSDGTINAPPYWGPTSWLVMGSGGQISTTGDTGRFYDALRENRLLEPEWTDRYFGDGVFGDRNGDVYGFEMFAYGSPRATTYAVLLTNANKPEPGHEDETPFVRVARAVGDLVLRPYLPKYTFGIGFGRRPEGTVVDVVRPGSAADRAGLREGDLLLAADGVPFGDDPMELLDPAVHSGDPVLFRVRRGDEELEITVQPDPR
ncbi:MAG: serine hydrolase [Thermoanaerobaculia bacterium]